MLRNPDLGAGGDQDERVAAEQRHQARDAERVEVVALQPGVVGELESAGGEVDRQRVAGHPGAVPRLHDDQSPVLAHPQRAVQALRHRGVPVRRPRQLRGCCGVWGLGYTRVKAALGYELFGVPVGG